MPVPQFLEEGPFLQGGRRDSPVLRVSCVPVNIRAPKMLLLLHIPAPPVLPWCPPVHPEPSLQTTAELGPSTGTGSGLLVSSPGWTGSERSCTSSFPLWTLRCRILPLEFVFLSKSGWVWAALSDSAPRERVHPHSKLRPLPVQAEDSDGF